MASKYLGTEEIQINPSFIHQILNEGPLNSVHKFLVTHLFKIWSLIPHPLECGLGLVTHF